MGIYNSTRMEKMMNVNDKGEKYIEFHNLSNTFDIIRPLSKLICRVY